MTIRRYESWGRYPKASHASVLAAHWRKDPLPLPESSDQSILPYGNGRSYGDVCLNEGNTLLDTRGLDRFIAFDPETGILRCEGGVLLSEILDLVVPQGWFLPVTPGTRFVTVGGAIANDVHGKNHHRSGTFGCHVRAFELVRSDGSRRLCACDTNAEYFGATIGGLGLTGLITWADLQLRKIDNPFIAGETVRYQNLQDFFALSAESDRDFEYTVAWIDCLARGPSLGRGVFIRGNHAERKPVPEPRTSRLGLAVPFTPPISAINGATLKMFNAAYYYCHPAGRHPSTLHYAPFFYPLDSVAEWNRIYGPRGFLQYQFVVPLAQGVEAVREILQRIARASTGSFLAVLKIFGERGSPGWLSFPQPGVTLALDFPNVGTKTFDLLAGLDGVVREANGRLYPAKDARMSGTDFRNAYPMWHDLEALRDPRIDSSFWRRVREEH